jgi:hypothetical protein
MWGSQSERFRVGITTPIRRGRVPLAYHASTAGGPAVAIGAVPPPTYMPGEAAAIAIALAGLT